MEAGKPESQPGKIYAQLAKIMAEVGAIAKDRQGHQYKFRGIDDCYFALQALMAKHGVVSLPCVLSLQTEERLTAKKESMIYRILTIRYRFYAEDGSFVDSITVGEGSDRNDKASNKGMSAAEKYCLLQTFKIPTEERKDSEYDNDDISHAKKAAPTPAPMTAKITLDTLFDPNNEFHEEYASKVLTKQKIDKDFWFDIATKMVGVPFKDLGKISKAVMDAKK